MNADSKGEKYVRITVAVWDPEETVDEQPVWETIEVVGAVEAVNWEEWDRVYVTDSQGNRWVSEDQGETFMRIGVSAVSRLWERIMGSVNREL